MSVPVGIAGPLRVDGEKTSLPMATTEGTLIASSSRGCKAINAGGGVITVGVDDGQTILLPELHLETRRTIKLRSR